MSERLQTAIEAAKKAGEYIESMLHRRDELTIENKDINDFVSEVDRNAEKMIIETLTASHPDDGILGEETGTQNLDSENIWIIDPLDGTTNFLHGFPQFAVSIALKHKDELTIGVVFNPASNELYHAEKGQGAFLNDKPIQVSERSTLETALIGTGFPFRDFTYEHNYIGMFRAMINKTAGLRRPGSAAMDLATVACGRFDGFWEMTLCQWDIAAGIVLVREAGGVCENFVGEDCLESGNIIAGPRGVVDEIRNTIEPYLEGTLKH